VVGDRRGSGNGVGKGKVRKRGNGQSVTANEGGGDQDIKDVEEKKRGLLNECTARKTLKNNWCIPDKGRKALASCGT